MAKKFFDIMNIVTGLKLLVVGIVAGLVALPFYGLTLLLSKFSLIIWLFYLPFYFMVSGWTARTIWGWK